MKKLLSILLAMMLLVSLAACGGTAEAPEAAPGSNANTPADAPQQTQAPQAQVPAEEALQVAVNNVTYSFTYEGVELVPGTAFPADKLPKPALVYQVPSCAFEGTDNVYSYNACEVTAFDEGNGEFIYSVYLLDPNQPTNEGLALGDDAAKITQVYGENYLLEDNQYTYFGKDTQLVIIVSNDFVASIEFRMDN